MRRGELAKAKAETRNRARRERRKAKDAEERAATPRPLTEAEAEAAYDAAVPVPLSEARLKEIVEYATRGGKKKKLRPEQAAFMRRQAKDELRQFVGKLIVTRFKTTFEKHGISFDPDTCYEAAEDVLRALGVLPVAVQALAANKEAECPACGFKFGVKRGRIARHTVLVQNTDTKALFRRRCDGSGKPA